MVGDIAIEEEMTSNTPLPAYLVQRYKGWKATKYVENKVWYKHLAEETSSRSENSRWVRSTLRRNSRSFVPA